MIDLFDRWAIIITTVLEGSERNIRVGHTLVQKTLYLLQAANDVDVGYNFKLYHYGPYSDELWGELRLLSDIDALKVTPDAGGYGYWISPGDEETYRMILGQSPNVESAKIGLMLDLIGHWDAKELELVATTHFMYSKVVQKTGIGDDELVKTHVTHLKPHFVKEQVDSALDFLREQGWDE